MSPVKASEGVPVTFRARRRRFRRWEVSLALLLLSVIAYMQIGTWRSNVTVWDHAVRVTTNNALAHHNLAHSLVQKNKLEEAIKHYEAAIRIKRDTRDRQRTRNSSHGIGSPQLVR